MPHSGGADMLKECLESLRLSQDVSWEVIVVDNGSGEKPTEWGIREDQNVHILHFSKPLGFAIACNKGVEAANGELIFLLNNDAVVEPTTLKLLQEAMKWEKEVKIGETIKIPVGGAVPKILSYWDFKRFDYSSAAGGFIDRFGFPFARGRIFNTIEEDHSQYDTTIPVLWGAGCGVMVRKDLYLKAGKLEELFFAHMEEIDLFWRLCIMGYGIMAVPQSRVYHRGAVTIKKTSWRKRYLNFRNSLMMLIKNSERKELGKVLLLRGILEGIWAIKSLLTLNFKDFGAIIAAWSWILTHWGNIWQTRRKIQALRTPLYQKLKPLFYPQSIAWDYFIKGKKSFKELEYYRQLLTS
ncbi:MAG: glycosyltransferase family 2 protein [bacterium]